MKDLTTAIVTVFTAIIGVAIIAVLVSKNANTTGVIASVGQGFSASLGTALSPVTGAATFNYGMAGGAPVEGSYY